MPTFRWAVFAVFVFVGCTGSSQLQPAGTDGGAPPVADCQPPSAGDDGGTVQPDDRLPPLRLLRRAALALRGAPPTDAELAAIAAAGDEAAQYAAVDAFIDAELKSPDFYRTMFESAREWMAIPPVANTADQPEYGPPQQRTVRQCAAGTAKAGAWAYFRSDTKACDGLQPDGTTAAQERTLEPWWAPGTTVTLVGFAASTSATGIEGGKAITCNARPDGTCGCGPNAVLCFADTASYGGWDNFPIYNEKGQRRMMEEEPARLFAHLVWYDRPLTDLVLGAYSVAPTRLQAAYVSQGIAGGRTELADDDRWWNPAKFANAPVDPLHEANDPYAWREYSVPDRLPFFLADRDYRYDPRTTTAPMQGIPAAGALTSLGFLNGYPRERVRGARALETFACEVLAPPSGLQFNRYERDPAREGPCQHCHSRVDPAAIHFKRYAKNGNAAEGYGALYFMPGIGEKWHWPAVWRTGQYPYGAEPFAQWRRWYMPDSALTPVTAAQADANPEALFIDFLPPDQTLLGQKSDGTVGPLGFAKLIVAAGAFDRCMVRRIHTAVIGRDIDPTTEAGYLDAVTSEYLAHGRQGRALVKALTQSALFRRGL